MLFNQRPLIEKLDAHGMIHTGSVVGLALCRTLTWLIVFSFAIAVASAADIPSVLERYPGTLVSVGEHSLHLDCRGSGTPSVILESGLGGFSLEWHRVRQHVANGRRVCAYDRAGYGWSDTGPMPRTAMRSAEELHALLIAAGEQPPYLLVGHSYGGFIVRLFAERYADDVAGVVLLDASAPKQFVRLPASVLPRALIDATKGGRRTVTMPRPIISLPEADRVTGMQLMMLPKARRAYVSELTHFEDGAKLVDAQPAGSLDVQLIVVSRARNVFGTSPAALNGERIWHEMQHAMTAMSARSDHWVAAGAGHLVHADRPDLVALAVRQAAQPQTLGSPWVDDDAARMVLADRFPSALPINAYY